MDTWPKKGAVIALAVVMGLIALLPACGGGGQESPPPLMQPGGTEPSVAPRKVVITIGNLTDLTGPSASAQAIINMALDDVVDYFNKQDMIPGAELKVITYDDQLDPSKAIPGYEWLKGRGADLIFTGVPGTPAILRQRADDERFVIFAATADLDELTPPGYVFSLGTIAQHEAYTLLNWISQNDWDYKSKGPAKIGGASWDDGYSGTIFDAMERYAKVHPDQFEWAGGHLTNFTFTWGPEVEALKDCDYLFPCVVLANLVKEYRDAGYGAKFIGADPQAAFLSLIRDADLWDEIDGMLFIRASQWWNERGLLIDLTNQVLRARHPDEADAIIRSGVGYIAFGNLYMMLDIIRQAVEAVGAQNFDSEALYDTAQRYSIMVDGVKLASFDATKRYATNYYGIYEARAAGKDLFRADPAWYPKRTEP